MTRQGAPNARMGGRQLVIQANTQIPQPTPAKGGGLANWSFPMHDGDPAGPWRDAADVTVYVTYAEEPITAGDNAFDGLGELIAPGGIDVDLGGAAALQTRDPIVVPRVGLATHFCAPIGIVKALSVSEAGVGARFNLDCAVIPGQPVVRWVSRATVIPASDGITPAATPWQRVPDFARRVQVRTIGGLAEIAFGDGSQAEIGSGAARFTAANTPLTVLSNGVFWRLLSLETFSQSAIVDFEVFA